MYRIVPAVTSLQQHLQAISSEPHIYRPARCPHCGLADSLWSHGHYERKAVRPGHMDEVDKTAKVENPIPILRFLCGGCRRTCSRLPAVIAPRRWYGWLAQQRVLGLLLLGQSLRQASAATDLRRHTVRRWWRWLAERSETFELFLKTRFAELGRAVDWQGFWIACFDQMPLRDAMASLDNNGVVVP
jgi:transposase-like protein